MLLAVCPTEGENWRWEHLTETISETFERAKKLLVTFEQLKQNPALSHLLPAVVAPLDRGNLNPNLDLGRNEVDRELDENGGAPLVFCKRSELEACLHRYCFGIDSSLSRKRTT